jgi:transcription antitermination factor NusG
MLSECKVIGKAWYAVRVRSNREQVTSECLKACGYDVFLPTYRRRSQWSDRIQQIEVPLFSGYVFCHFNVQQRLPILKTSGVVNIVSFGNVYVPISDNEIAAVRTLVNSPVGVQPWPYLAAGERVRVKCGPLAGVEGIILKIKNEMRVVVSISLLQRSIAAEINAEWLSPVSSKRTTQDRAILPTNAQIVTAAARLD